MSSRVTPEHDYAAPRAGAELAAARERLGLSVAQMASYLRIRRRYLEALEQGRIAELPGNAYALAFLRTYAAALGLDPDELSRRFKAEASEVSRKTELAFPAPLPERGVPAGAVMLLGLVLAVGAYVGWYRLSGDGRLPPETVPPVPAQLVPLAQRAAPTAPARSLAKASTPAVPGTKTPVPPATGNAAAPAPGAPAAPVPAEMAAQSAPPDISPSAAAAATPAQDGSATATTGASNLAATASDTGSTRTAATDTPASPPPQSATNAAPAAQHGPELVQASADAWIEVRGASGKILVSRILHPGETWPVPKEPGLVMTTGNAGGTELVVNGVAGPPLGAPGAVLRNVRLSPDAATPGAGASSGLSSTQQ